MLRKIWFCIPGKPIVVAANNFKKDYTMYAISLKQIQALKRYIEEALRNKRNCPICNAGLNIIGVDEEEPGILTNEYEHDCYCLSRVKSCRA
jgi:hypothetical protein